MTDGPESERVRNRLLADADKQGRPGSQAQIDELRAQQERTAAALAKLAGGREELEPAHLGDLDSDALAERERAIRGWVDEVVTPWLPRTAALLKGCWREHDDARLAVNAAFLAWQGCHVAPSRKLTDPAAWLQRDLPALEKQLRVALGGVEETCLEDGHDLLVKRDEPQAGD